MNIKLIKLLTGEELLSDVISATEDGGLHLKNPVRVVMIPNKTDPRGHPNVGLAPWAEFAEEKEIKIKGFHVVAVTTPVTEFRNQYNQMFGNGLVTPPSSKLIIPGNDM